MTEKRSIDRQRESAIYLEVGGDDKSPISGLLSTGKALYTLKPNGIYKLQLADDIDPYRTNPGIPHLNQQVLTAGTDHPIVSRILLTAKYLFDTKNAQVDKFVGDLFDLSLLLTRQIIELDQAATRLIEEVSSKRNGYTPESMSSRNFVIPSVTDLDTIIHDILMRSDKIKDIILGLFRLHFETEDQNLRQLDRLGLAITEAVHTEPQLLQIWEGMRAYFVLIRNARNASEHPKIGNQIIVTSFVMQPNGELASPLLELQHPTTPIASVPVEDFLRFLVTSLVEHAESSLAFIKLASLMRENPFGETVAAFPPEKRRNPHVRFYRALPFGDALHILG